MTDRSLCLSFLLGVILLCWTLDEIECGGAGSKGFEVVEAHLPGTSWHLIDVDPESMAMIGQGEQFPVSRQSKVPKAEAIRTELFIMGDVKPTLNFKKTEERLSRLSQDLNELAMLGKLDADETDFRLEVNELYSISISVKATNCNQMDAIFLDKLEAMTLKYKEFPNIYNYLNFYYGHQLRYCQSLFDQLLFEAWKKKLDKISATESTRFSKAYEEANVTPRENFIPNRQANPSDSFTIVRGKRREKDLQFWTLIDATSSYLLKQLATDDLAKTGNAKLSNRLVQSQLHVLDFACQTIRELFSGLARIHELLERSNTNVEMKNFPSNEAYGPIAWLRVAKHCNLARGIFFNYSEPIERAYKRKVVTDKFPESLLQGDNTEARRHWHELKLKLYETRSMHSQPVSSQPRPMAPQETLATLEKLIRLGFENNWGPNSYFFDISDEVELLDVRHANELRCFNGFFETFDILLGKFSQYTVNVQPYLMHFYEQQIDLCRAEFAKLVYNTISLAQKDFEPTTMDKLDRLRHAFMEGYENAQSTELLRQINMVDSDKFERLLAAYLLHEIELDEASQPVSKLNALHSQFDEIAAECFELASGNLHVLLDTYDRIREYSGLSVAVGDDEAANWILIGKVCQRIQFLAPFRDNLGRYI